MIKYLVIVILFLFASCKTSNELKNNNKPIRFVGGEGIIIHVIDNTVNIMLDNKYINSGNLNSNPYWEPDILPVEESIPNEEPDNSILEKGNIELPISEKHVTFPIIRNSLIDVDTCKNKIIYNDTLDVYMIVIDTSINKHITTSKPPGIDQRVYWLTGKRISISDCNQYHTYFVDSFGNISDSSSFIVLSYYERK